MAIDGTHGPGRSKDDLRAFSELGMRMTMVQETRRDAVSLFFSQEEYVVYCSGNKAWKNSGQGGVGLAMNVAIVHQSTCSHKNLNGRVLEVSCELMGKSKAVTFIIGYGPAEVQRSVKDVHAKTEFWELIERAVKKIPATQLLIV